MLLFVLAFLVRLFIIFFVLFRDDDYGGMCAACACVCDVNVYVWMKAMCVLQPCDDCRHKQNCHKVPVEAKISVLSLFTTRKHSLNGRSLVDIFFWIFIFKFISLVSFKTKIPMKEIRIFCTLKFISYLLSLPPIQIARHYGWWLSIFLRDNLVHCHYVHACCLLHRSFTAPFAKINTTKSETYV